jgi:hypothetical protein
MVQILQTSRIYSQRPKARGHTRKRMRQTPVPVKGLQALVKHATVVPRMTYSSFDSGTTSGKLFKYQVGLDNGIHIVSSATHPEYILGFCFTYDHL